MKSIIEAGGSEVGKVVKTTVRAPSLPPPLHPCSSFSFPFSRARVSELRGAQVFLHSMDDFKAVNAIYAEFFGDHKPARSAVQVARLPLDALFEIEAIVRCVLTPHTHQETEPDAGRLLILRVL